MDLKHFFGLSLAGAACLAALMGATLAPAAAQSLAATVNGDPITSADLDERMKLLRVLRRPATREAALESMIADSLRYKEVRKYGIQPGDDDIGSEIVRAARIAKIEPQQLAADMQRAGISSSHLRNHWLAEAGYSYYVRARNRNLEPSDAEVRAEAAAQGKSLRSVDYRLQEVLFIVPRNGAVATLNQRSAQAQQLRARFSDCETGIAAARGLAEVAVKSPITRNSSSMNPALKKILDDTPIGHLSPPQRDPEGISMVAVCGRKDSDDLTALRTALSQDLLNRKVEGEARRLYEELRSRAVIVRR